MQSFELNAASIIPVIKIYTHTNWINLIDCIGNSHNMYTSAVYL